jgi:1-acyl-sn-glycerol-3-phosphate acyltransferase
MPTPLDARNPESIRRAMRVLEPLTRRAFRYAFRGIDALPPPPVLLVGNHSGAGVIEILCMFAAWHARFGESRPAFALANDVSLSYPGIGDWLRAIGGVPASYANGREVLAAGRDLLVFPGGDVDSFRPFYRPREVVFGNRRGYARLALETGVPVVPVATIGAHFTYLMAPGNAALARVFGLKKRARLDSAPMTIGTYLLLASVAMLGLGLLEPLTLAAVAAAAATPLPVRITSEALEAIDVANVVPDDLDAHTRIERAHDLVFGALVKAVAELQH